jgi:hypothetical protein
LYILRTIFFNVFALIFNAILLCCECCKLKKIETYLTADPNAKPVVFNGYNPYPNSNGFNNFAPPPNQPYYYNPQQQMYNPQQQMYNPQQQMYNPQQQMYNPQQLNNVTVVNQGALITETAAM